MEIIVNFAGNKKVNAKVKEHIIKTDQSLKDGGDDSAPSPFDLFLASTATCVGYYVKAFCESRNLPTEGIKIIQKTEYDSIKHLVTDININIELPEDFPDKYKEAIIATAGKCKVKKHLENPPSVKVNLVDKI